MKNCSKTKYNTTNNLHYILSKKISWYHVRLTHAHPMWYAEKTKKKEKAIHIIIQLT